jgi:hypothetical protein
MFKLSVQYKGEPRCPMMEGSINNLEAMPPLRLMLFKHRIDAHAIQQVSNPTDLRRTSPGEASNISNAAIDQ